MPKTKGKGKKVKKDIDWAADANFDKMRAMIYIEHSTECPIFQIKAEEFQKYLSKEFPDRIFQLVRNHNSKVPPRPGAFEIQFSQTARTSLHHLWSGIENGPPRRDKFPPDYEIFFPEVEKVLKKFYPDAITRPEDDFGDDDLTGGSIPLGM